MQQRFALLLMLATAVSLLALLQPTADAHRLTSDPPESPPLLLPDNMTQIFFTGPPGMRVRWDITAPGRFDSEPLICPERYNFAQGGIYPLKVDNIPGHAGLVVYPCIEVAPPLPSSEEYLQTSAIPVSFLEDDFVRVAHGEGVTKVVYLPSSGEAFEPPSQGVETLLIVPNTGGVKTLVSSRLEPGRDPIIEADRRGAILAVVRIWTDPRLWFRPPFMSPGVRTMPPSRPANQEQPAAGYRR